MNLRGQLFEQIALSAYTSWRVGGIASRCYKPADSSDLAQFLKALPHGEPITWLGLGSNTLIRDAGLSGTVIFTQGALRNLQQIDQYCVKAEAGVGCAQLARFCARQGLTGLEFLAGIPGTVGGALAMNAGCHGSETWSFVEKVETIRRSGELIIRNPQEYHIGYRKVILPAEEGFVAGYFRLQPGTKEQAFARIQQFLEHRTATQPIDLPNCGSVFRNPPGDYAGRLIEACGLKGWQIGGAAVSTKHANFIVNLGYANASDIEQLINYIVDKVQKIKGINLEHEVRIIGT